MSRIKPFNTEGAHTIVTLIQNSKSDTFIKLLIINSVFRLEIGNSTGSSMNVISAQFLGIHVQANNWYQILLVTCLKSGYINMMVNGEILQPIYDMNNDHRSNFRSESTIIIGHKDVTQSFRGIISDVGVAFNAVPKDRLDYCIPQCKEGIRIIFDLEEYSRLPFLHPSPQRFIFPSIKSNNDLLNIVKRITYYNRFNYPEYGKRHIDIRVGLNHNYDIISVRKTIKIAKSSIVRPHIKIIGKDQFIMKTDDKQVALMKDSVIHFHQSCGYNSLDRAKILLLHRHYQCDFIKINTSLVMQMGLTFLESLDKVVITGSAPVSHYKYILDTLFYHSTCPFSDSESIITIQAYASSPRFASNVKYCRVRRDSHRLENSDKPNNSEDKHGLGAKENLLKLSYLAVVVFILCLIIIIITTLIANRCYSVNKKSKRSVRNVTTSTGKSKLSSLKLTQNRLEAYKFD